MALGETTTGAIVLEPGVPNLFIDDLLIQSQENLRRTLHQPTKDGGGNSPILALDEELAGAPGTLEANGSIVYDPKLKKHVMFALGFFPTTPGEDRARIYRFTSDDAMTWIKGDDGKPQRVRIPLDDPASGTSAMFNDLFSCFYDTADAEHPYKGWAWLANWGEREGIYYVHSRDGRTWERGPLVAKYSSRKIEQDSRVLHGPSDVSIFYPDPARKRFLALLKFHTSQPIGTNHLRSRAYTFIERLDQPIDLATIERVALVPAASDINGDKPGDEFYGSTAWRYGSHWLGGLKVWHRDGDYPHSAAGCAFLKLAVSRDGLVWKKVSFEGNEVFLPNGREGANDGRNDGGYITEFSQGPLRIGNELIFYYGASSWGKNHPDGRRVTGGGIFRARLRPDGFVSVDAGTLTTPPLRINGNAITVNAVGPVTVDLLNTPKSFDLTGDSLAHPIAIDATDKPIHLRFTIKPGGRLYSFAAKKS